MRAVVADPVVVTLENGVDDLRVVDHVGEHVDRGVHDLADHAVLILLGQAGHRVLDAGVDQVPAALHLLLGLGQVEVRSGDPQAPNQHGEIDLRPGQVDPLAALPAVDHARSAVSVLLHQSVEDLRPLNHVRVAGIDNLADHDKLPLGFGIRIERRLGWCLTGGAGDEARSP